MSNLREPGSAKNKAAAALSVFMFLGHLVAHPASAGPNADASLGLHVASATSIDPCMLGRIPGCTELNSTEPSLVPMFIYIIVENADATAGIGGASFGIYYGSPGPNILTWNLCADNQTSSSWPASHSGLSVSWNPDNCQHRTSGTGDDPIWNRGAAVVGYFYCAPYAPTFMALTPDPSSYEAMIVDCSGVGDNIVNHVPSHFGVAGLGGYQGYDGCGLPLDIYPCSITGSSAVESGSSGHVYSGYPGGSLSNQWTISGNGILVGPTDGTSVIVQAGAPGTFTLQFSSSDGIPGYICGKAISVTDAVPTLPISWSALKTLYGDQRRSVLH